MATGGLLYGRTSSEWVALTNETVRFLRDRAGLGRLTNYTELNSTLHRRIDARLFDFGLESERAAIGHLLARAVEDEMASTGLMLSAIVLYLNDNDAGPGFYTLAEELGLLSRRATADDRNAFWLGQIRALEDHYRRDRRRRPNLPADDGLTEP